MRHLEVRDLWLQKEVAEGKVIVSKIWGTENPADLMTKGKSRDEIMKFMEMMKLRVFPGRAEVSPDRQLSWSACQVESCKTSKATAQ